MAKIMPVVFTVPQHSFAELLGIPAALRDHQDQRGQHAQGGGLCGRGDAGEDGADYRQEDQQQWGRLQQLLSLFLERNRLALRGAGAVLQEADVHHQHQAQRHHHAGEEARDQHVAHGSLRGDCVEDQDDRRRDHRRQRAHHCHQAGGGALVVALLDHAGRGRLRQRGCGGGG